MKKIFAAVALFAAGSAGATIVGVGDVTDNGDGSYFIASGADLGSGVSAGALEGALGVSAGFLDDLELGYDGFDDGDVINGSAITRSIYLQDGNSFSFDWEWSTNEPIASLNVDFAFITLAGGPTGFEGAAVLADTFALSGTSGSFSFTLPGSILGAGQYTIGIGVVDVDIFDPAVADSFLDVSNFVAVPAPAPLLLLALGLIGIGAARRK